MDERTHLDIDQTVAEWQRRELEDERRNGRWRRWGALVIAAGTLGAGALNLLRPSLPAQIVFFALAVVLVVGGLYDRFVRSRPSASFSAAFEGWTGASPIRRGPPAGIETLGKGGARIAAYLEALESLRPAEWAQVEQRALSFLRHEEGAALGQLSIALGSMAKSIPESEQAAVLAALPLGEEALQDAVRRNVVPFRPPYAVYRAARTAVSALCIWEWIPPRARSRMYEPFKLVIPLERLESVGNGRAA